MVISNSEVTDIARQVVEEASARRVTVSFAESLTAGMVASTVADIPGASAVLRGGAVTYCDEIKHKVLGVSLDTLARHSAVSAECAREMAAGARALFDTDFAISLTGYAGPDGGTPDHPAGTVFIGCASSEAIESHEFHFAGSRNEVRAQACARALSMLLQQIMNS